jgi:hypothetical protein
MLKWKVLEDDKECEECENGRCWRNVLLMQQSSIYSRRSFVGSVCGTIRLLLYFQQSRPPYIRSISYSRVLNWTAEVLNEGACATHRPRN